MIKMNWVGAIPRPWLEIATQSLEAWKLRDEKPPFLSDNRRGFARVTPIALSKSGVPYTKIYAWMNFHFVSRGAGTKDMCGMDGPPERLNRCT